MSLPRVRFSFNAFCINVSLFSNRVVRLCEIVNSATRNLINHVIFMSFVDLRHYGT